MITSLYLEGGGNPLLMALLLAAYYGRWETTNTHPTQNTPVVAKAVRA